MKIKSVVILLATILALASCGTLHRQSNPVTMVQVDHRRDYTGKEGGQDYLSVRGPRGSWEYRTTLRPQSSWVKFLGNTSSLGVRLYYNIGLGVTGLHESQEGLMVQENGKKAHSKAAVFHKSIEHSLSGGDYYTGMMRYRTKKYGTGVYNKIYLKGEVESLIRINDKVCWKFDTWRLAGLNEQGKPDYSSRMGVIIHCPVSIDGKPGDVHITYGVLINPQYLSKDGVITFPNLNDYMVPLEADIAGSLQSLKILLPNVTQPDPIDDELHRNIRPLGG